MRYSVTLVLVISMMLTIVGCNKDEDPPNGKAINSVSNSTENKENKNVKGSFQLFHLGMSIEEVRSVLKENNIEIINEIENIGDSDAWDWGNKAIWTEGISFSFDQDFILYDLEFENEEPTSEGIKVGDGIDLLRGNHGDNYKLYSTEELIIIGVIGDPQEKTELYEYLMDDHYFRATVVDSKIVSWGISKFKLGTNSPITEYYSQVSQKLGNPIKTEMWGELQQYLEQIHSGENSKYKQIIASDRARGLLSWDEFGLIELTPIEFDQVYEAAVELRNSLTDSVVYTGYSSSGGRVTAVLSPLTYESKAYYEAINHITNQKDEHEFLNYIMEQSDERTLEVGLDVSVENLAGQNEEFILNEIVITNPNGDNPAAAYSGEDLSDAMTKYNRTTKMVNNNMRSGEWYTFAFDGTLIVDPTITIHLNEEQITLERN